MKPITPIHITVRANKAMEKAPLDDVKLKSIGAGRNGAASNSPALTKGGQQTMPYKASAAFASLPFKLEEIATLSVSA